MIYNTFPPYDVKSQNFCLSYGPQEKVPYSFKVRSYLHFPNIWALFLTDYALISEHFIALFQCIIKLSLETSFDGNRLFQSYSRLDLGSFRSYSLSVRSFRPGSFRPNFRGGSFRPNSLSVRLFRPNCRGGSFQPNFGRSFQPTLIYRDL